MAASRPRTYGVYVIQLTGVREPRDHPHLPHVYVGQSWYSPEERFAQHRDEYRTASRRIRGQVWRLRPELYVDLPRVERQDEAIELEEARGSRLAEAGFTVRCNGVVPKVPASRLRPFGRDELVGARSQLLDAIGGVTGAARRRLSVPDLVRILRWDLQGPVDDLIVTPNEWLGRFAHAEESALEATIAGLAPTLPPREAPAHTTRRESSGDDAGMWQIGPLAVRRAATCAIAGQTVSGVDASGRAREYELTGPDGLRLTIRDTTWANGERDVTVSERHDSPEPFDTLVGRLRLSVLTLGRSQYVELQQARRRGTRAQTFRADLRELSLAAGLDVAALLRDNGAFQVGSREQLLDDQGRRREYVVATFASGDEVVPVLAYVVTRVAPIAAGVTA